MSRLIIWTLGISISLFCPACKKDQAKQRDGFPEHISKIISGSCATAGCHTETSRGGAAGLSLESWSGLFEGANNGNAAVVPYAPDQSPLLFFINTFDNLGPTISPAMPYNADEMTQEEVKMFMDWVAEGAPNALGEVAFAPKNTETKMYVINSMCSLVAVIDGETGLVMRYISVDGQEFPEAIEVSPDGERVYLLHQTGEFTTIDAKHDVVLKQLDLGEGWWRSLAISPDSKYAMATDFTGNTNLAGGQIVLVNLETNQIQSRIDLAADSIYFPYGATITKDFTTAYVSCYKGNFLYKFDLSDINSPQVSKVLLQPGEQVTYGTSTYKPGNIEILPDQSAYFVLCERSKEIRKFSLVNDELLGVLSFDANPRELCIAAEHGNVFVSCTEDQATFNDGKGAVHVVDFSSMQLVKSIYTGYQPRGMVYDKQKDLLYVANRNADPVGADAPHHYTDCDGNNGYLTTVNLGTLEVVDDYKPELSVDPYAIAIRE